MGIFSAFKRVPVYIKISKNKIEITNLESGDTISRQAMQPYSTDRFIVADFNRASELIQSTVKELLPRKSIFPTPIKIIIQQTEPVEGGLSEIEKRALRDLGEMTGATSVYLITKFEKLSNDEILSILNEKTQWGN